MLFKAFCNRQSPAPILGSAVGWLRQTKTLLVVQLTAILLTICSLTVTARSVSQSITFSGKDVELEKIFAIIKQQTGHFIFYQEESLANAKPVTIKATGMPLAEFMSKIMEGQPLTYSIKNTSIIIKSKSTVTDLSLRLSPPPPITVRGRVVNEKGEPIVGATIQIKGTDVATTTNENGDFIFYAIEENSTLVITSIGYKKYQTTVLNKSTISIELIKNESELDQIVIIPYGKTTKRFNTGSISKVSSDEISRQPVSNPLATLEGRVPGLIITQTTGMPGGAFKVELRGRTAIDRTLTDDQPLFVIDGVPFGPNNKWLSTLGSALGQPGANSTASEQGGTSPLNNINPQDIESIEILKDADATAIYGSRGANGVVLITTKKPKGKSINFNLYSGFSKIADPVEMMDTKEYVAMRKTAFANDGEIPTNDRAYDFLVQDSSRYTNFNKLLTGGKARVTNAQVSMSGGKGNSNFLISGAFRRETSIMPGDYSYQRGNVHFNLNHSSEDKRLQLLFSANYTVGSNNLSNFDPLAALIQNRPNLQVYDESGNLAWNEKGYSGGNPMAILNTDYLASENALQSNIQLSYSMLRHLVFRVSGGYNLTLLDEKQLSPGSAQNPLYLARMSSFNMNRSNSWLIEPQLEFSPIIRKGKLTVLLGSSLQSTFGNGSGITGSGYSSDELLNSVKAATSIASNNWNSEYRYGALFGRVNYNLLNKYLLNVSGRRDGSSRFGPGKQFANFSAAGAAWIFSEERWLKEILPFISFGKVRSSYGVTGNDKITDYQYLDTWMSSQSTYNALAGLYPNKLFNPDYRWEKTTKLEGALDLGFIKDKLLLTVARYVNRSSNQLVNYQLASTAGFPSVVSNLPAKVENSGWEFSTTATNIKLGELLWNASANVTIPKNRLVSFPGLAFSSYASRFVEGSSLNLILTHKYTGIDQQTGLFSFEDRDANGVLNEVDYQVLGNLDPILYGGLQNSFNYKNFQLDLSFSYRKQTGLSYLASIMENPGIRGNNLPVKMTDFWSKTGDIATLQRLSTSSEAFSSWNNFRTSDGVYTDASFIRLKNVALSYNISSELLKKIHMSNCRVYLQGQNLLTITGYELADPETQNLTRTPPLLTITIGLQATF